MTTKHAPVDWFAGDDWEIRATLLDENGEPFDLNAGSPEIKWTLVNSSHQQVLDEDDTDVSITDAAKGKCSIKIAAAKTAALPTGHYNDAIRLVIGGVTSTMAVGPIYLIADPWATAVVALRRAS